jgi:NDP-sugar pyrophosphorylase family protein
MTTYGGFGNFETYLVAGWLKQHDASWRYWQSIVRQERQNVPQEKDVRSDLLDAQEALIQEIQRYIYDKFWSDVGPLASHLATSLLDAAARRVDWLQLARFVVNGIERVDETREPS